jgi:predicted metal-dependent phosphoesterase TrpH
VLVSFLYIILFDVGMQLFPLTPGRKTGTSAEKVVYWLPGTGPLCEKELSAMFKLETHCHTSEVSGCSRLPAVQLVTQLKRSGYGGAVITDHFHHGYFDSLTGSWTQKIDCFLSGYRAAREAGAQAGLHIYCGLEFRTTTSDNDYLLFGAAPELLYSTPELHRYTIPQLRALADREGLLLVQAHPFRTGLTREDPALLDGVEVFNGNARHDSHNDDALRFARENGLLFFSGSDHHETEDRGRGGMVLPREPKDEADLVRLLPSAGLLPDILLEFFPVKPEK